jgi:predicted small integral membrane protein
MIDLEWMAWTAPTAAFFVAIAALLVGMTAWEIVSPTRRRRGWLPIATTRGDRLFVGLLASAFLHLAWLGWTDWSLWPALFLSLLFLVLIVRSG